MKDQIIQTDGNMFTIAAPLVEKRVVLTYPVYYTIYLPKNASILSVQVNEDNMPFFCVYADPNESTLEKRDFIVVGTGEEFEIKSSFGCPIMPVYIGSYQINNNGNILVYHVFYK